MSDIASHLIQPLSGPEPGGRDMTYDPARLEIEEAFTPTLDDDSAGGPQNWSMIVQTIRDQAEETRDFWLASYLARAGARLGSLDIAGEGVAMMIGLLERCWDVAYPDLETYGFEGRKAPCEVLARPGEFAVPLLHGLKIYRSPPGGSRSDDVAAALESIATDLRGIETWLMRFDGNLYPSLQGAYGPLDDAVREMRAAPEQPEQQDSAEADVASQWPGAGKTEPVSVGQLVITSRDDVENALLAVIAFYQKNEPASPIPILLRRCQSWIDKDFLSVLRDLAPGTVDEVERLLGGPSPAMEASDGE